jgi:hypothetical protein
VNLPPPDPSSLPPPVPPQPTADRAVPALVLGIIGIVLCPICAPFAWSMGGKIEHEIDACAGALGGRGMATAARVLGIVGTVLLGVYVLVFVVWVVLVGLLFGSDWVLFNELSGDP